MSRLHNRCRKLFFNQNFPNGRLSPEIFKMATKKRWENSKLTDFNKISFANRYWCRDFITGVENCSSTKIFQMAAKKRRENSTLFNCNEIWFPNRYWCHDFITGVSNCSSPKIFKMAAKKRGKIQTLSNFNEIWFPGRYWCPESTGVVWEPFMIPEIISSPGYYGSQTKFVETYCFCSVSYYYYSYYSSTFRKDFVRNNSQKPFNGTLWYFGQK